MSQCGLNLNGLLADQNSDVTPVQAMRTIMTRGKEHGWTMSQLFGIFLEVGREEGVRSFFLVFVGALFLPQEKDSNWGMSSKVRGWV